MIKSADIMAIVNLNEDIISLKELTEIRPLASVPIGGRYRVIDFLLSNLSNSGIFNVGVFVQRKPRSLNDHLGDGSAWDLDRLANGLFIFYNSTDFSEKRRKGDIYQILENMDFIQKSKQKYVLVANPYMIYNMDFNEVLRTHINGGKSVTAVYKKVNNADREFFSCETYHIENDTLKGVGQNMCSSKEQNIALECFIMDKEDFISMIYSTVEKGTSIYLNTAINKVMLEHGANLHEFKGYVKCINTIKSYVDFKNDILDPTISRELFKNENGLIYTKIKEETATYFSPESKVENSIIASGCIIEGTVKNSIIFRRCHIKKGAVIEDSIIFQNTVIEENTLLQHVLTDKNVVISENKKLIGDFNMPIVVKKGVTI